jgi:hypothetical protein
VKFYFDVVEVGFFREGEGVGVRGHGLGEQLVLYLAGGWSPP